MKKTSYRSLYESVLTKIKDFMLVDVGEEMALEIISEYLTPAITLFSDCKQNLKDRDDDKQEFNFELSDVNFQLLSNYMVICYIDSNYIRTGEMLKSHLSSTDFHKYDNKDVLAKVLEVRKLYKNENDQLMIEHSYESDRFYDGSIFDVVMERKR